LWIVRHGQSSGNVARDAAESAELAMIDIATRDMDVPLSDLGKEQSAALGRWFAALPADQQPEVVLCSPYVRALQTAKIISDVAGLKSPAVALRSDERLREKEFGILDRLTKFGIAQQYPALKTQRDHVGKFYFRPPGGESWCDVILRLRNVIDMLTREFRGDRVLLVGHQVIVNCFRYLLEHMEERQILDIDRAADVPNCAVTSYEFDAQMGKHGGLALRLVNFVAPLHDAGTTVTAAPDKPTAVRS
jgi:broad specificity phosphatase PhoE